MNAETKMFKNCCEIIDLDNWFSEDYFKDKKVVYVQI